MHSEDDPALLIGSQAVVQCSASCSLCTLQMHRAGVLVASTNSSGIVAQQLRLNYSFEVGLLNQNPREIFGEMETFICNLTRNGEFLTNRSQKILIYGCMIQNLIT